MQTNKMKSKLPCYETAIPSASRIESHGIQTMPVDIRQEIVTAASNLLANSNVRELRHLRFDGKADQLKLSGRVRSCYHKQLDQETIRCVTCGMQIVNPTWIETRFVILNSCPYLPDATVCSGMLSSVFFPILA